MTCAKYIPAVDISTPVSLRLARRTDEMDAPPGIHLTDLLLQHLGSVDRRAGSRYTCDQYFGAIRLECVFDASPVGYLERCDGWT